MSSTDAINAVRKLAPDFEAKIAITIGSGLGKITEQIEDSITIPFTDIPGVVTTSVAGHASNLILGYIHGVPVAALQGRLHYYEAPPVSAMKIIIRLLKQLGCEMLVSTNASGSLRKEVGPGELVLIHDHINFQGTNPLVGPNDDYFGPRFVAMDDVYDIEMRQLFHDVAETQGFKLTEGVYMSVMGPCFETPAEIRAFKTLGAEVIGMSTVPEVILAKHAGLKVAVVASITNWAAGLSDEKLSHEHTLHHATRNAEKLTGLVSGFIKGAKTRFKLKETTATAD